MDFLAPIIDLHAWNTDFLPSKVFDLTLSTLKQVNSTIEDIYDSYYSPPITDHDQMDTLKEATVGCDGWGNQQL